MMLSRQACRVGNWEQLDGDPGVVWALARNCSAVYLLGGYRLSQSEATGSWWDANVLTLHSYKYIEHLLENLHLSACVQNNYLR